MRFSFALEREVQRGGLSAGKPFLTGLGSRI